MVERNGGRLTSHRLDVASPEPVRNVVLVGPSQAGKTTLVEALLLASGALNRAGSIVEHNTVCDFEESERAHERSSSLAVAPTLHAGCKINLVDSPGSNGLYFRVFVLADYTCDGTGDCRSA